MLVNFLLENKTEIKSDYLGEELWNLGDRTFTIPETFQYQVIEVTDGYVARMDIISKHIYGTPNFSDVLCKLNGISNPFELNVGDKIIVPDLNDISKFYYKESIDEMDSKTTNANVPKAKSKIEKRKPNEAVIGDKRYRIDSTNKVIVY